MKTETTLENAIAIISTFEQWSLRSENRKCEPKRYVCALWESGANATGRGPTPLEAIEAARVKLGKALAPKIKLRLL